jgi:hypothetical protein
MKKTFVVLTVCALSLAAAPVYAGTIVFSENFDELTAGLAVTSVGQFTAINGTNVDIVSAASGWASLVVAPESGNVVDLGGSGGDYAGQLQSTAITLGPGTYDLSFDLVGSQRGVTTSTSVTLGPAGGPYLYDQNFALASGDDIDGIVTAGFTVISPETVWLNFTDTDPSTVNIGSLLDNVEISSTPEPSTLLLLGSGLATLAGWSRRKITARS